LTSLTKGRTQTGDVSEQGAEEWNRWKAEENFIMPSFITCTIHSILFG
jgi:hypothetical protein